VRTIRSGCARTLTRAETEDNGLALAPPRGGREGGGRRDVGV